MSGSNVLVRGTQLSRPERNPGRRPSRAEEILSARAEAYLAQGVAQEVSRSGRPAPESAAPPAGGESGRPEAVAVPGVAGPSGRSRGRPVTSRARVEPGTTSVAQLVEHRFPKPAVGGSIPSARAVSRRTGRPDGARREPARTCRRDRIRSVAAPGGTTPRRPDRASTPDLRPEPVASAGQIDRDVRRVRPRSSK